MHHSRHYQPLPTGEAEKEKPGLAIYNSQPTTTTRTLIDILDDSIKAHPQHLAIGNGQTCLTYHQLQEEITTRLATLRASHIGAGDRVGIRMASGTVDLYVSILAVLAAGAAYVPVDADDPDERANTVWAEAGVCAILTDGLQVQLTPPDLSACISTRKTYPSPHSLDHPYLRLNRKTKRRSRHARQRSGIRRRRGFAISPRTAHFPRRPRPSRPVRRVRCIL